MVFRELEDIDTIQHDLETFLTISTVRDSQMRYVICEGNAFRGHLNEYTILQPIEEDRREQGDEAAIQIPSGLFLLLYHLEH